MKHILAKAQRPILEQFAWSNVLLGLDFDGTLAPIVREPGAAQMRKSTRARLVEIGRLYPCAIISGRGRADVASRVLGVKLVDIVGNHGMESSLEPSPFRKAVRRWSAQLEDALAASPGVEVEDKGLSIAIHYRKSRKRKVARAGIDLAVAALPSRDDGAPRVVLGKLVVNVLPDGAPHKGLALRKIRAKARADTALYVGDDVTDEDVFTLDEPGRLLSVRVGRSRWSAAPYYLQTQAEIDDLLDFLLACRSKARLPSRVARR